LFEPFDSPDKPFNFPNESEDFRCDGKRWFHPVIVSHDTIKVKICGRSRYDAYLEISEHLQRFLQLLPRFRLRQPRIP
jgi:hypothetical protein